MNIYLINGLVKFHYQYTARELRKFGNSQFLPKKMVQAMIYKLKTSTKCPC